jgi:hypothetical protein
MGPEPRTQTLGDTPPKRAGKCGKNREFRTIV